jgi:hypothetical protein
LAAAVIDPKLALPLTITLSYELTEAMSMASTEPSSLYRSPVMVSMPTVFAAAPGCSRP